MTVENSHKDNFLWRVYDCPVYEVEPVSLNQPIDLDAARASAPAIFLIKP
jgi:hypothetical protein